jgi:peptidyl-tRNA hydrolase
MSSERWLVIGLGNPGDQYAFTRHNIGQMVINYLAINTRKTIGRAKMIRTDRASQESDDGPKKRS